MESKERSSVGLTWLFTYLEKIFLQNSIKCLCCFGLIKWEPQISPSRIVELLSLLLIPIWTNVCAQQRASVICLTHRMVLFCEIGFVLWSIYINYYIYNFSLLILVFFKFIQLVYHDSCMFHFRFDSVLNSSLPIKFERRFSSPFNDAMANGECLSAVMVAHWSIRPIFKLCLLFLLLVLFFSFVKILKKIPKLPVGKSESITCTVIQMKEH